jgi:hypothetical protein
VICLNLLFVALWAKGKEFQGVQAAIFLHGLVIKDMVILSPEDWKAEVIIGSRGDLKWVLLKLWCS